MDLLIHVLMVPISSCFQDLVSRMLAVEPSRRPTALQVLQHRWMTTSKPPTTKLNQLQGSRTPNIKVNKHLRSLICEQGNTDEAFNELQGITAGPAKSFRSLSVDIKEQSG